MGRPIIASRVPGCQDVVVDGTTGLLCEARDADRLTEAMSRMLEMTEEQRAKMGLSGRERMLAEFDERTVVARYFATVKAQTGVTLSA